MAIIEQQQTAVLFFSRTPQEEAVTKKMTFRRSREALQLLLQHSLRQARRTHLPIFTCYGNEQRGDTFGERLAHALEDVFARGYANVLIIGNDSPGLSTSMLQRAQKQLQAGQLVLGPAVDGGVYLIGINKKDYHPAQFLALDWENPELQTSWQYYIAEQNLTVTYLQELTDIDSTADFWAFFRRYQTGFLGRMLRACLHFSADQILQGKKIFLPWLLAYSTPPDRGPPYL